MAETIPQSRIEDILDGAPVPKPQSRIEKLLLDGGGTGDIAGVNIDIDESYVLSAVLKKKDGTNIGEPSSVDLPLEEMIVSGYYDDNTKKVVLNLRNGSVIQFSVADLVSGLQSEITTTNKLSSNLVDDTNNTNLFVTSSEKTTWNGKQNALSFDSVPTDGSTNPVESNGIYDALAGKVDKVQGKGLSTEDFTTAEKNKLAAINPIIITTPEPGSSYPVTSDGIYTALAGKVDKIPGKGLSTNDFTDVYKKDITILYESPLNHNGVYRGKDLTDIYTIEEMYEMVHDGSFYDLFLGDYFIKSITTDIMTRFTGAEFESGVAYYEVSGDDPVSRTFTETTDAEPQSGKIYCTKLTKTENISPMFGAFDYYYNMGDTALTDHHAVLIMRNAGFATTAKMNATNTTAGGYYSSDMHQIVLPCYSKSLKTALGNHLLAHNTWLTTAVNATTPSMAGAGVTGAASASAWRATELQLMNEVQLYGFTVWSSSAYDTGIDNRKLPVFDYIDPVLYSRNVAWLRSVVSGANFAYCSGYGLASTGGASSSCCVNPLIVFG